MTDGCHLPFDRLEGSSEGPALTCLLMASPAPSGAPRKAESSKRLWLAVAACKAWSRPRCGHLPWALAVREVLTLCTLTKSLLPAGCWAVPWNSCPLKEGTRVSFPSGLCLQGSHYHSLYGTCQTLRVLGSGPCAGTVARWPVCVQQEAARFAFVWPHSPDERFRWVCAPVLPSGLCCRVSQVVMGALWHTEADLILLPSGGGTTEGVLGHGLPQACSGEHDPELTLCTAAKGVWFGWTYFWSSESYEQCSITHTSAAAMNRKVEGLTVLGNESCCPHCDSCQWLMQPTGSHCCCPALCWWGLSAPSLLGWLRAGVPVH